MNIFFKTPKESYHMRQIARTVGEQINAVRRELISMEKTEFLLSRKDGIKKFFFLNPDFPYYNEFRSIAVKSSGIGYHLLKSRKSLGKVKYAILTHTYLSGEMSDATNLDLVIVGEPDIEALDNIVKESQVDETKEIFYTVLSEKDLESGKKRRDPLVYSLLVLPRATVIGNDEEFVVG